MPALLVALPIEFPQARRDRPRAADAQRPIIDVSNRHDAAGSAGEKNFIGVEQRLNTYFLERKWYVLQRAELTYGCPCNAL